MGYAKVGQTFQTGNATIKESLPAGATLKVVKKNGVSTLEVVSVPQVEFKTGDRIMTKHGPGTVVRLSSRFGSLTGYNGSSQLLYVSDSEPIVRRIAKSDAKAL
jgi:hypothetical protein